MRDGNVKIRRYGLIAISLLSGSVSLYPGAAEAAPRRPAARKASAKPHVNPSRQRAIDLVKQAAGVYNKGNYAAALNLCKSAAKADITYPRAYVYMGVCHQKLGNAEEAVKAYRWAVALRPSSEDARRARRGLKELGEPPLSY
jgi:Tfp pilus assembly protein PilF